MLIDVVVVALLVVLALLVLFYRFVFARDPMRVANAHKSDILSPADGRIGSILKTHARDVSVRKGLLGRIHTVCRDVAHDCVLVSIVMTPLDVHFQRAPADGVVKSVRYVPGKFLNAVLTRGGPLLENEHNEILIERQDGAHIKVIQIAGGLARRIRCFVQLNEHVKAGGKIGFIDLGSQVTLVLPAHFKVLVKEGMLVRAAESVIAHG